MPSPQTNLKVLRRSNKRPEQGDIFAMGLSDGTFLSGRVVGADLEPPLAPTPSAFLIYVYRDRARTKATVPDDLGPDRLLLPPLFINRMPWTKGYFETLHHKALNPAALLAQHCFWDAARARFVDERQQPLVHETQPRGDWALCSYRWLDDRISDALGIPRVPE